MYGQLPGLRHKDFGDDVLPQTGTIMRYLAKKAGAYGKTDAEAARIDALHDGMADQRDKMLKIVFTAGDFVSRLPYSTKHYRKIS